MGKVHASLFSGFGAADLAATWMGWDNAFWCEIDEFPRTVLSYWFPKSKGYENIKETDFTPWHGKIDVLTGGFPCQPFSVAGQRKGQDDDRYLWPEMLRAIREIRPTWVIGENVGGILSMVQPGSEITVESQTSLFEEADKETILDQDSVVGTVCCDLEQEGYSVRAIVIPACAVGAPHRRDRIFFIAYRSDAGVESLQRERKDGVYRSEITSDSNSQKLQARLQAGRWSNTAEIRTRLDNGTERFGGLRYAPYAHQFNGDLSGLCSSRLPQFQTSGVRIDTYAYNKRFAKQRLVSKSDKPGFGSGLRNEARSRSNWQNFPTQSPVCRGNDGLPFDVVRLTVSLTAWRTGSVKGYGNAIVPQVMYEIFKAIEESEK